MRLVTLTISRLEPRALSPAAGLTPCTALTVRSSAVYSGYTQGGIVGRYTGRCTPTMVYPGVYNREVYYAHLGIPGCI